jgi:hypothetical protein
MTLTNQEAFDKVVVHLSTMKGRSINKENGNFCSYRTPEGNRCAIGALIPDELYVLQMDIEGLNVKSLIQRYENIYELFEYCDVRFLQELQSYHDEVYNWSYDEKIFNGWSNLYKLATAYKLNTEVLDHIMGDKSL